MIRMPLVRRLALIAVLAVAPAAIGQAPTSPSSPVISGPAGTYFSAVTLANPGPVPLAGTWSGPAGVYTFALPSGSTINQTAAGITITFGTAQGTPQAVAPVATPSTHPLAPGFTR